ncbi:MAG TPA: thiamine phosphate synthase [Stellaceae bacterium]|nr:thiamine phosphate synthase [Stellaceae bacterium]
MVLPLPAPPLLVITDGRRAPRPLEEMAAAAFDGGCRWLSLREKDLSAADRLALLRRLVALGRRWGAVVGVHEDVGAAQAAEAGAVHLPDGASIAAARRRLGPGVLIGASAHGAERIKAAAAEGADYVTISPIFASASKPGYGPELGLVTLANLSRDAGVPVLGLGGIDATNIASVIAAGAAGAAVMGAVMAAEDPALRVAALVAALRAPLAASGAAPT